MGRVNNTACHIGYIHFDTELQYIYLIIVNVFLTISIYTCLLLCSFLTTGERPAEVLRNENHYEPLDRASAKDFVWNFDAGLCVILLIFITV